MINLVTYMLFRGILCPFIVWYPSMVSSNSPLFGKFMGTALLIQSYYFILQMFEIIKKKLVKYKEMK